MSQTKIVATIGPASATPEKLLELHEAGMSVARMNGSHNTLDWHSDTIRMVRRPCQIHRFCSIYPAERSARHSFFHEPTFLAGETVILMTGSLHDGSEKVPVNYSDLHEDLFPNATILADDGTLRFTVTKISGQDIHCRAETNGQLKSASESTLPFVRLNTAQVTERDHEMIGFARKTGVDFVGVSFAESVEHIKAIREINDSWPRIVSKIENQNGLDNMEDVIAGTDAIMIDRGDLSVETNLESLAVFQNEFWRQRLHTVNPSS